jgi:hypothetical protein
MENAIYVVNIAENFDKNLKMLQKYPETVCAWIIIQICVLHG